MSDTPTKSVQNVVIWGAGKIGRGFAGDLFDAGGYRLTLVDAVPELIERLRTAGRYTVVNIESATRRDDHVIAGYEALTTGQEEETAAAVAEAAYVVAAAFPRDFPAVTRQLASGLRRRRAAQPDLALDIILCTNLSRPAALFRPLLLEALPPDAQDYAGRRVGVVETVVIRAVVDPPAQVRAQDPLQIWTNGVTEFPVDRRAFKGDLPRIPGLRPVDDIRAEETRKLYTYNLCHAALAYLGARRGYTLIEECFADPGVRAEAESALREVSRALQAEFGFSADEMARWVETVLGRMDNPALGDTVARVGADPLRKLRRADRLTGSALLARRHGIRPAHLARVAAAALRYENPADPGAVEVQQRIAHAGLPAAVRELCELTPAEDDLAAMIAEAYQTLA